MVGLNSSINSRIDEIRGLNATNKVIIEVFYV